MHWPIRCTRIHPNSSCFLRKPPLKSPMKLLVFVRMARKRSKIFRCVFLLSIHTSQTRGIFRFFVVLWPAWPITACLLFEFFSGRSVFRRQSNGCSCMSWIPKAFPVGEDHGHHCRRFQHQSQGDPNQCAFFSFVHSAQVNSSKGRRSKFYVFSCLITKNRYVNISVRPRAVNLEFYVHPRPRIFRFFGRPAVLHPFFIHVVPSISNFTFIRDREFPEF